MKRISIGTWAYSIGPYENKPVPWDEVLSELKRMDFDGVELGGFSIHPNPDNMPEKEQRQECKKKLADHGLAWSGLAANLWEEQLINTADTSVYLDCFRRNLQFCVDLGIPAIRVDTVQPPTIFSEVDEETARERVVSTWKQCSRDAAEAGIYVTWEFEPGFAFNKPSDVVRICGEIDDDNFWGSVRHLSCPHGRLGGSAATGRSRNSSRRRAGARAETSRKNKPHSHHRFRRHPARR